jgi:hypothetical protein
MTGPAPRERRPARRKTWPRRLVLVALVLLVFALGIALGQALNDGPPPPSTVTYVRTLTPVPQRPATTVS